LLGSRPVSVEVRSGRAFFCGPTFQLGKADCPAFQVVVKKPNYTLVITSGGTGINVNTGK